MELSKVEHRELVNSDYAIERKARAVYQSAHHTWLQQLALNTLTATYYIVKEIEEIEL